MYNVFKKKNNRVINYKINDGKIDFLLHN